jgi:hypothetical protein
MLAFRFALRAALFALLFFLTAPSFAGFDTQLGLAANYAVLGIGGTTSVSSDFEVYQSATVVNGNVGIGPYSVVTHDFDGTINGTLYYDTTDIYGKTQSLSDAFSPANYIS